MKPSNAPFICIEPWYGLADSTQKREISVKEGIIDLRANEKFEADYTITIG